MSKRDDLLFSTEHEWTTGTEGEVTVGISDYALEQLGDVVFIELPQEGDEFHVGDTFGTIESTKTVSDLYLPVSGVVTAINHAIVDDPNTLMDDPYEEGWLIKVECSEDDNTESLMTQAEYHHFIKDL